MSDYVALTLLALVSHEYQFVIGMLQYAQCRLVAEASKQILAVSYAKSDIGFLMNLHCGHNNAYSKVERLQLKSIADQALGDDANNVGNEGSPV